MLLQRMLATTTRNSVLAVALIAVLGPAAGQADQLILDDLIVKGSSCVGLDCLNGQPFSFTTLMLKENNLRLFWNDTSVVSAFPKNDWEIVANDSMDGGASYLGFADRGAGIVSVSGQGTCDGGANHGLVCDDGSGATCFGVCVGGTFDGAPCPPDPSFCSDGGGECVDAGICVPDGAIVFRIEAGAGENSLVIDSLGNVHISGDLTVNGTINGSTPQVEQLLEEVATLQAEVEAIKAFPALKNFLDRK